MDYLDRYRKLRADLITRLGGHCVSCGSVSSLEFDHTDPTTKSYDVSKKITNANIEDEVSKLQLLCNPCHKAKSRLDNGVPHGGGKSGKRNCKCAPCKLRKAEYMRQWKRDRTK